MAKNSDANVGAAQSPTKKIVINPSDRAKYREFWKKIGNGKIGIDIYYLIKSRYKILYIRSPEERRVTSFFKMLSLSEGFDLFQWDCSRGLLDSHSMSQVKCSSNDVHSSPLAILSYLIDQSRSDAHKREQKKALSDAQIYLLLDFHAFLSEDGVEINRKFKEFAEINSACTIVIVSPRFECPISLEKEFTLLDFPYPSKSELRTVLNNIKAEITATLPQAVSVANTIEEELLQATAGLTVVEAENAYALSVVKTKTFDIATILDEKKQIIRKNGILEYRDSRLTFDDIGGLDTLKEWFKVRRAAFSDDAKQYGLPPAKGCLLAGTPGCGKSAVSDALASYWRMPLLRLDMGTVFGSLVGESESRIRSAISVAEAVSPCCLLVDEVEKGLSGGGGQGAQRDGGTTARVLGTLLTWLQDKTSPVFVICTANDVLGLPPEFMRAGRFDEIFFVDLPNEDQRRDVTQRLLLRYRMNPDDYDVAAIAHESENYSPAEIEKGIQNGMYVSYFDKKRKTTTADILSELKKFQPLYNSRREDIEALRKWALGENGQGGRAVLANSRTEMKAAVIDTSRNIDLTNDLAAEDL